MRQLLYAEWFSSEGIFELVEKIINMLKTHLAIRTYLDDMRYAAQLVREYEIENNKNYRGRIAKHIEERANGHS